MTKLLSTVYLENDDQPHDGVVAVKEASCCYLVPVADENSGRSKDDGEDTYKSRGAIKDV